MQKLKNSAPSEVFRYFEELGAIARGSGNTSAASSYCEEFAKAHSLKYIRDEVGNVVIFKNASCGYEGSEPVILQGHLDMVCQKNDFGTVDPEKDGVDMYEDGDFIKARGTTLGADNGIAVAMILAVLEDENAAHPPIEAVFTVDEEIGMLGAMALDMSVLKARRMINIDSEEDDTVTVSCAGGEDITVNIPIERKAHFGTEVEFTLSGLLGGHSGMEINSGRVNAALLGGRLLDAVASDYNFELISVSGGNKANAIPSRFAARLCVESPELFCDKLNACFQTVKNELSGRENGLECEIVTGKTGAHEVFDNAAKETLITALLTVMNGVVEMSAEIPGLVQTSLNLGITETCSDSVRLCISLRSCKKSAQRFLERRISVFFAQLGLECEKSGYYPPWEYRDGSRLEKLYCDVYKKHCGTFPKIAAIHAGLECGVFASALDGIECISVGPSMFDVHTVNERLVVSSVGRIYAILREVLENLK